MWRSRISPPLRPRHSMRSLPPLEVEVEESSEPAASEIEDDIQDLTLPDLDDEVVSEPAIDLASTFAELFSQRQFGQILELAAQSQEAVEADPT